VIEQCSRCAAATRQRSGLKSFEERRMQSHGAQYASEGRWLSSRPINPASNLPGGVTGRDLKPVDHLSSAHPNNLLLSSEELLRTIPTRATLLPTLRRLAPKMADLSSIQHRFFTASRYAVAGASNNTSKFGYILLDWFKSREIPVTPVTPTSDEILGLKCIPDVEKLQDKRNTSLSIVTPPKVSKTILEQALKDGELAGLWLQVSLTVNTAQVSAHADGSPQPGAEDREVVELIKSNEWLRERTVYGGPCVLVLGDKLRNDLTQGKL
jgi:predicted CoA-binding protein